MRKNILFISLLIVSSLFNICYTQTADFGAPLSLTSAIQIGLANNPEIKAFTEKVNASKGRFWNGISPPSPDLSVTNDYVPAGQTLNRYGEKSFGISQSIDFPTNYALRGSKYAKERHIAENELAMAKLSVISSIKKAYFNALALQEQVKIAQENLAITKDFVKKAEIRYSVGEGTNLEKLTAKVNYTEALNNIEVCKNHLVTAFAELNFALGFGKGEAKFFQLADSLVFIPVSLTFSQLSDDATSINPQLKISKLRFDTYSIEKSLAWSGVLPNFNLSFFNKNVRNDVTGYYGASFSVGIPLWFMLEHRGRIIEASANVASAEAELQTIKNTVYTKTLAAYTEFKHEERQVELYVKEILPQAEEIFRTATKSYEAGEITYIEFLQAQQTLINSRGSYINALLSYNNSIITIEESIGNTLQ